jgi:hypothetical protein
MLCEGDEGEWVMRRKREGEGEERSEGTYGAALLVVLTALVVHALSEEVKRRREREKVDRGGGEEEAQKVNSGNTAEQHGSKSIE